MGINTNIYLLYGWKVPMNKKYCDVMDERDYSDFPHTLNDFEDSTVWIGEILDQSGDLRWDMPNFSGWEGTEDDALEALNTLDIPPELAEIFPHYEADVPRFHLVTIYS